MARRARKEAGSRQLNSSTDRGRKHAMSEEQTNQNQSEQTQAKPRRFAAGYTLTEEDAAALERVAAFAVTMSRHSQRAGASINNYIQSNDVDRNLLHESLASEVGGDRIEITRERVAWGLGEDFNFESVADSV